MLFKHDYDSYLLIIYHCSHLPFILINKITQITQCNVCENERRKKQVKRESGGKGEGQDMDARRMMKLAENRYNDNIYI